VIEIRLKFYYGRIVFKMNKTDRLNLRYDIVKFALKYGNKPASREFKTSVKVVRKWVNRYSQEGISGLNDRSRRPHYSPNKCASTLERKIIKLRLQTKNKFGARRLIERFDLKCGTSCISRIIREHNLVRKKKTKKQKRNELWSIKKLMGVFEKIQIDVKELIDIPVYFYNYTRRQLPKYEFTARCVKTGATFVCFAKSNNAINAASFAIYLMNHLKAHGFDLTQIEIQTDNGAEFNACGHKKVGLTPFEVIVKEVFHSKLSFIPPASPTFNSDVETFHRLVEDEFYSIEPVTSLDILKQKMMTFLIDFNYLRKNSYKDNKTPYELAKDQFPKFSISAFNLAPVLCEDIQYLYHDTILDKRPEVTKRLGLTDPFETDPSLEFFAQQSGLCPKLTASSGGDYLSGLHSLTLNER
jgi:transposase